MWPNLSDLAIIYAVLTPISVLYSHTTALLLDRWVGNSEVQLLVGFASAVAIAYFHDAFRRNAPTSSSQLVVTCYETAYDYMVKLSCLCYYLGCRSIYHPILSVLQPAPVAVTAAVVLITLRGFRNVLSLPVIVHNDSSVERYRPASTLTFSAGIEPIGNMKSIVYFQSLGTLSLIHI